MGHDRVRLFRLAWDLACSSFAGRQVLYERFFAGDLNVLLAGRFNNYDRCGRGGAREGPPRAIGRQACPVLIVARPGCSRGLRTHAIESQGRRPVTAPSRSLGKLLRPGGIELTQSLEARAARRRAVPSSRTPRPDIRVLRESRPQPERLVVRVERLRISTLVAKRIAESFQASGSRDAARSLLETPRPPPPSPCEASPDATVVFTLGVGDGKRRLSSILDPPIRWARVTH